MSDHIRAERIQTLNEKEVNENGKYILYWMQQSQRAEWNQALEFAIEKSQDLEQGVVVVFGLMDDYPEANLRHYVFMLEGLKEVSEKLVDRNIKFILEKGQPSDVAKKYAKDASLLICDRGYLKHQKKWRKEVAENVDCKMFQVECDVIVPIETASEKEEYAARTIRPKLHEHLDTFKEEIPTLKVSKSSKNLKMSGVDISNPKKLAESLQIDKKIKPVSEFKGGTSEAKKRFKNWLENSYKNYDENRNQPSTEDVSKMSPYLHFGQISPLWILEQLKNRRGENRESYVEELLVRRELAANFCFYNEEYDSLKSLPDWAAETLEKHKDDEREKTYTAEELENAETDDEYWNQAMRTMKENGYLHNHMRMYWGKQFLRFTGTPQFAHKTALALNNKYFLDGRDCNSFANVAWLFGKHDRAWQEREVYGKVRIMTKKGLEGKIDE